MMSQSHSQEEEGEVVFQTCWLVHHQRGYPLSTGILTQVGDEAVSEYWQRMASRKVVD
jgi:hypothetical protein